MGWYKILRRRGKLLLLICILIIIVNLSGVLIHPFEQDLNDNFSYPVDLPDFRRLVDLKLRGQQVDVQPINSYDYRFIIRNAGKCDRVTLFPHHNASLVADNTDDPFPRLVFVIKSALSHRRHRDTIRRTWGFEERFSDVQIRRVFVIGSCDSDSGQDLVNDQVDEQRRKSCQDLVDQEDQIHNDIVQADFIDSYYNNTIKSMVGLKWLTSTCPDAEFAFFVDDDYYVSTKNLLKYARYPFADQTEPEFFDGRLYAGWVFATSPPMRHKISKWYISLDEYPYSLYPPYVTAGAYLLSNRAFREIQIASSYVKHFRFDDIYMGILSKKIGLVPRHCHDFYFYKKTYDPSSYSSVIASHGYDDHNELSRVWNEQKALGNC
jgi:hypothetical protein